MLEKQTHTLLPVYDQQSKILILGSFPSPKSREIGFYYGHPSNRFWQVMQELFQVSLSTIDDKINFLHTNHIALWDVIESCQIDGAKDSSIKDVKVNDILTLLQQTNIKYIFTTGKKAYQLYQKHLADPLQIEAIYLPSTSPLNASYKLEQLVNIYQEQIMPKLK